MTDPLGLAAMIWACIVMTAVFTAVPIILIVILFMAFLLKERLGK
jgi:hypothetical protein